MNRAVFLDRDGVINQEPPHYAHKPEQMILIPKSSEAIKLLNKNNFLIVVVSNQAGVAKGYYSEKDVVLFNKLMENKCQEQGAKIDAIYCCYHHPDAKILKYRINCDCRKPKPGMLKIAERELNIDLKQSFMVGDKKSDIEAGKSVGCNTIMVLTGYGKEEIENDNNIRYDSVANNLFEATGYILDNI